MSALSPEVTESIEQIVTLEEITVIQRFLARRALKKAVLDIEPLIEEDPSFGKLAALADHAQHDEKFIVENVVRPDLEKTAEILLAEIPEEGLGKKDSLGLAPVWASLEAWDVARTETTRALAARALKNFWGTGQARLLEAFELAEKTGKPNTFKDALWQLNDAQTA